MSRFEGLLFAMAAVSAVLCSGCGSDVGVQVEKMSAKDHMLPGSPEDRIKAIQADPNLPDVEKQRRIAWIKEKNHLP